MNIKICGLVRPADAELALALGATHLGCVVAPDSPRSASWAERRAIAELARGRASFVLVVRGVDYEPLRAIATDCEPDLVQWHGLSAAREDVVAAELPLLRVRAIAPEASALPSTAGATTARPFVLDGGRGGQGRRFPWTLLGGRAPTATFIAGGITPDLLPELISHAPWGIDVSSGIESAPGHKDHGAMRALFQGVEVRR